MKWFKHDSNANMDAKLKKVRAKYGMEGYGVYWYCLELVAQNIDKHNLTFELEHDAEMIALDTNIHYEIIQEMMQFFIKLGLFENTDGLITCLKMATRTDEYTQVLMRRQETIGTNSRQTPYSIGINSQLIEEKEEKEESNGKPKRKTNVFLPPCLDEIQIHIHEKHYSIDAVEFYNFYESKGWMIGKNKMKSWKHALAMWESRLVSKTKSTYNVSQTLGAI